MNFSFRRLAGMLFKVLLKTLLVAAVIIGGCVFIVTQQNRSPYEWEQKNKYSSLTEQANTLAPSSSKSALVVLGPKHSEFQKLICELHPAVGSLQFVNSALIRVTFATETNDKQPICQAIANLWSFKTGEQNVCAQCWEGSECIALGIVNGGRLINAKP